MIIEPVNLVSISLLLKTKGWLTIALGVAFLLLPHQLMAALGAEMNHAGIVMVRLFGLLAIAAAWGMVLSGHVAPAGSEALATVALDIAAMTVLVMATNDGVFGSLAYAFAAVYGVSSGLYLYFYFYHRREQALAKNAQLPVADSL